jgi:AcrR family transcriptional regulator
MRRLPTQARSRQRVDTIVTAAFALLREGGSERFTMAALAVQAGLTPPSLYRYFPDASAVLKAVAETTLQEMQEELEKHFSRADSRDSARAALHQSFRAYYLAFQQDRALREIWIGTLTTPELTALNVADSRRNGEFIASMVSPWSPLDPNTLRTRAFLLAHLTGASIALLLETEAAESERLLQEIERLIDTLFIVTTVLPDTAKPRPQGRTGEDSVSTDTGGSRERPIEVAT